MRISRLKMSNVRSFRTCNLPFSPSINVFVGPNNAGKSTIVKAILRLQDSKSLGENWRRLRSSDAHVHIYFDGATEDDFGRSGGAPVREFEYGEEEDQGDLVLEPGSAVRIAVAPSKEPGNPIYPYLSRRKAAAYDEAVNSSTASTVTGNLRHLYAKVDKVTSSGHGQTRQLFERACKDTLGLSIATVHSTKGKRVIYPLGDFENIELPAMGEGVANILGLLVDLCVAKNKVFIIEELENDIHPRALKRLLGLVAESSQDNQFFITTHSNIVTNHLGAMEQSSVFSVQVSYEDGVPTSTAHLVVDPKERRELLESLGYELSDLDLWEGWLILEESSAEKIIRKYLIPWFVPELSGRLRTFSARCKDEVIPKFEGFNNLFMFLNREPAYRNKAWVIIDGGKDEEQIITTLREKYAGWEPDQFLQFDQHDFELYYPEQFQEDVKKVLETASSRERQEAKKALLAHVDTWAEQNPHDAKDEFSKSAAEVIERLRGIRDALLAGD